MCLDGRVESLIGCPNGSASKLKSRCDDALAQLQYDGISRLPWLSGTPRLDSSKAFWGEECGSVGKVVRRSRFRRDPAMAFRPTAWSLSLSPECWSASPKAVFVLAVGRQFGMWRLCGQKNASKNASPKMSLPEMKCTPPAPLSKSWRRLHSSAHALRWKLSTPDPGLPDAQRLGQKVNVGAANTHERVIAGCSQLISAHAKSRMHIHLVLDAGDLDCIPRLQRRALGASVVGVQRVQDPRAKPKWP